MKEHFFREESSRRAFFKTVGLTAASAGLGAIAGVEVSGAAANPPIIYLSATELARLIAKRQVSALEVAEAHLKRIEEVNPKINAIVQIDAERVRAQARAADNDLKRGVKKGPLHGVPFTIKDCLLTKGMITTNGCPELRYYKPTEDATVVKRLKDAGGILLGKTNVPEMCLSDMDNVVYGRTNNPYDLARSPGGSSGGEAAIIAAAGSPCGLGSDFGNSIRSPAHYCGIAGLKPTSRRVPGTGLLVVLPVTLYDWNSIGPMARYVEDLELVLRIISGPDGADPYVAPVALGDSSAVRICKLRVALCPDDGVGSPTKETANAVEKAAQALRDAGANVTTQRPPGIARAGDLYMFNLLAQGEGAVTYYSKHYARMAGTEVASNRHISTESALKWLTALQTERNSRMNHRLDDLAMLQQFREDMTRFVADYDAIISPVANHPAGLHPDPHATPTTTTTTATDAWNSGQKEFGDLCQAFNLTGWPAAVVRAGTSPEGLPIGVQIAAKPWREDVALAVAKIIQDRCGGWQPPARL